MSQAEPEAFDGMRTIGIKGKEEDVRAVSKTPRDWVQGQLRWNRWGQSNTLK